MGDRRERTIFVRGLGAAALASLVFAVWTAAGIGGDTTVLYVDDLATIAAALAATVLCVRAGRLHGGRLRLFWWLLAGACAAWALGEVVWAGYDFSSGDVPVPSWADAAYLAGIPPAAAALLIHPALRGRCIGKTRSVVDGLVIAAALLFVAWTLLLEPLQRDSDLSTLGGAVTVAYPVGDVVLVFLVVLVMRGARREDRLDLWCLLAGLLAITLSDSIYGYLTQANEYETGAVIDVGWFAGYLLVAVGALCSRPRAAAEPAVESRQLSPVAVVAPFVPVLAALGLAPVWIQLGRHLDRVGWSMAVAVVALVLLRQALLAVDLLRPGAEAGRSVTDRLVRAVDGA